MFAAHPQKHMYPVKHLLLFLRASCRCKSALLAVGEASRKIAAVVRVSAALHRNFISGINLRHATQRGQQRKGHFEFRRCCSGLTEKPHSVMVAKESNKALRVWIKPVLTQNIFELRHWLLMHQHRAQREINRKVEWRVEASIDAIVLDASCNVRRDGGIAVEDFADRCQLRIKSAQLRMKLLPECAIHIRKGIDAKAIETRSFNPPDGILNKVFRNQRIFLVEIGQSIGEPAFRNVAALAPGRVRIGDRLKIRLGHGVIFSSAVEPVGKRRIFYPWVGRTYMVWNCIENDLHASLMQGGGETLIVSQCAEMRINGIHIGRAIAVIGLWRWDVLVNGCRPYSGDAQRLQIVEVLLDAFEVTAMPAANF